MPPEKPDRRAGGQEQWLRTLRETAPYVGLGLTLAITVAAGLGAGHWVDRRLGTDPIFLVAGAVLGLAAALYNFFRLASGSSKRETGPKR
jgi:F0F1-type ATP synthase assembly protein I